MLLPVRDTNFKACTPIILTHVIPPDQSWNRVMGQRITNYSRVGSGRVGSRVKVDNVQTPDPVL